MGFFQFPRNTKGKQEWHFIVTIIINR